MRGEERACEGKRLNNVIIQIWIISFDQIWIIIYIQNMDIKFVVHNSHLDDPGAFVDRDPQLQRLKKQKYVYHSPIIKQLPTTIPGIYTVGGGRQIGKTTLLKQWMLLLLEQKIAPQAIAFFSGEMIDDHHVLLNLIQNHLESTSLVITSTKLRYLIIDEVTYIRDWDKAIKYAADAGLLENIVLVLTGSDLVLIQEARMRFPGRRGLASQVDFHLYPLTFRETIVLKNFDLAKIITTKRTDDITEDDLDELYKLFNDYLKHGGYLTAINDWAISGSINLVTLRIYSDWIRGDMLRRGKQEHYLCEILSAIIKRYCTQVSWHTLAHDLSIDHHKTVADYVNLLSSMDVTFIQAALLEDKLAGAPKKAKKIIFMDPFIFHAIRSWLWPTENPYVLQIEIAVDDPVLSSKLVEACVVTHYQRYLPTYYIKAEGEVDIAYIDQQHFWPIEIKWTNQVRSHEYKQIQKYANGRVLVKSKFGGKIGNICLEPLPVVLAKL